MKLATKSLTIITMLLIAMSCSLLNKGKSSKNSLDEIALADSTQVDTTIQAPSTHISEKTAKKLAKVAEKEKKAEQKRLENQEKKLIAAKKDYKKSEKEKADEAKALQKKKEKQAKKEKQKEKSKKPELAELIEDENYRSIQGDFFTFKSYSLDENELTITYTYSGGCGETTLDLYWNGEIREEIAYTRLVFIDNDHCKAVKSQSKTFNIKKLGKAGAIGINIILPGIQKLDILFNEQE